MKRLIPAFAIVLGWASAAWAAAPAQLTTLQAIHALTNAEASHTLPVAFEGTVTYFPGYDNLLFVQDGDVAVFVLATTDAKLVPGDRVFIKGTTESSFRPIVVSNDIAVLRHGAVPKPVPATFNELIRGQRDCIRVTVRGVIRTADLRMNSKVRLTYLQMLTNGGYIEATVDSDDASALSGLLDAEVEVTGIAAGKFDDKMQQTGVNLHISSLADVKILKRASASPRSLPLTPLDQILVGYHVQDETQRVRVHGTITYYQPGLAIVLQDGAKSLWIDTSTRSPLRIGDVADATGFPEAHNGFLTLAHGEIEDSHVQAPITPLPATRRQLAFWSANKPEGHQYDLVSIEGQVVTEVREAAQDEYVLAADGQLFTAIYHHPPPTSPLPPMMQVPLDSRIRVTGICMIEDTNPFNISEEVPFDILLRSFDDISVVARPSLLNIRNLLLLVGLLIAVVFAVGVRGWGIERRVRRQTAAMAFIEQRRSRILEDINGSRPLAEIIEEITELVSFRLHGVPCWCQIADGALLGNCPPKLTGLRIVRNEIPARSGPPLGALFAAFDPHAKPSSNESEALSMVCGLATLAIETRRLYSDLLHRSEFDLLTDIHNRFSLDKHLNALIEEARMKASIFGLIYIDLDDFKQVNDVYGHQVGDLYLQEVAARMKRQLRGNDTLARLGGDEFVALITVVRNRAEAEEIAQRLEHSFDEPFAVEGYVLNGLASVGIALYPEDGTTKDSLLSAADAAMYVAKNIKREAQQTTAGYGTSEAIQEDRT
jgi:diguanylate cyclase (GGDEF)-like protein